MKFSIFKYFILLFLIGKEPVKKWIAPEIDYLTFIEEKAKYKGKNVKEEIKGKEISYGNMNFIFYKNKVYLFTKPVNLGFLCGTGIDYSKPFKQNITPDSLIEISELNFQKIVFDKIKRINYPLEQARKQYDSYELERNRINISIAIDKDSVKGKIPILINKVFRDKRINFSFVRRLTEEEREVAKAKYYKTPYNFDKINWKIGFSETELH
jgi:hypothetical protein